MCYTEVNIGMSRTQPRCASLVSQITMIASTNNIHVTTVGCPVQVCNGRGSAVSCPHRSLPGVDLCGEEARPGHCSARLPDHQPASYAQTGLLNRVRHVYMFHLLIWLICFLVYVMTQSFPMVVYIQPWTFSCMRDPLSDCQRADRRLAKV